MTAELRIHDAQLRTLDGSFREILAIDLFNLDDIISSVQRTDR